MRKAHRGAAVKRSAYGTPGWPLGRSRARINGGAHFARHGGLGGPEYRHTNCAIPRHRSMMAPAAPADKSSLGSFEEARGNAGESWRWPPEVTGRRRPAGLRHAPRPRRCPRRGEPDRSSLDGRPAKALEGRGWYVRHNAATRHATLPRLASWRSQLEATDDHARGTEAFRAARRSAARSSATALVNSPGYGGPCPTVTFLSPQCRSPGAPRSSGSGGSRRLQVGIHPPGGLVLGARH
jgi:hypothetical protein